MALKLMYITKRPDIAMIAEKAGIDRVFVDMEYIGKESRQAGLDSVKNHHTIEDVQKVRSVIKEAELLVRVNPIHDASESYDSSEKEIEQVISAGADIVMLPYFKTADEVRKFITYINGRAKVLLLFETPEAVDVVEDILAIPGIDEIHIGINDLSIGYQKTFMFELLVDGTVENLCLRFKRNRIPYGFGGIASIGAGKLPAELILKEHYRLGSSMVILSRSFCDTKNEHDINSIRNKFESGIRSIRTLENEIEIHSRYFEENQILVSQQINRIVEELKMR